MTVSVARLNELLQPAPYVHRAQFRPTAASWQNDTEAPPPEARPARHRIHDADAAQAAMTALLVAQMAAIALLAVRLARR